jgi:ornithine--oxo-acid transaminase
MSHVFKEMKYACNNYKTIARTMVRGKGIYVYDRHNTAYIDCISGYSAVNQGHCHPEIIKAAKKQMQELTLTSRAYHNNRLGKYSEMLCKKFDYDKVLLMNGGVESGESAIKIARSWGYKYKNIPNNQAINVFFTNNFWGRSLAACSSSNDPSCFNNFGPYMPGFAILEYNDSDQLRKFLKLFPNTVSVMLEPIQGEGGIKIPDMRFMQDVRTLCNQHNVLMIADEVQTGLYRTGTLTACEHYRVKPDILCLGKALSGGFYPISAVLAKKQIMDVLTPGTHGSTFGGNPLACAIGMKALQVLEKEKMGENAQILGEYFRKKIMNLGHPCVKDVRGIGLLNGIEMTRKEHADDFVNLLLEEQVLAKTTRDTVVRITPPLVIKKKEMKLLVERITRALYEL